MARSEACGDDKDEFSKWDAEFHLLIARASRNPLLVNVYEQINKVRLHAQWDVDEGADPDARRDRASITAQHRGIYQAIDQRDAQRAQALITEHLGKARDDLLQGEQRLTT